MASWTHNQCGDCWNARNPDRMLTDDRRHRGYRNEVCCFCSNPTDDGLYVRENPAATLCAEEDHE